MKTIAVIDDDVYINRLLRELLEKAGYRVISAWSGTEALLLLQRERADLVLLDLMLPGLSGEGVLERLSGVPVIVLSAMSAVEDKIKLLNLGAADYITKPFDSGELLARVSARLREEPRQVDRLRFEELELDTAGRGLFVNGLAQRLTRTEYAILKLLMENPGQVLAKSTVLERICLDTPDCTEASLKIHVSNLRKKLRAAGGEDHIEAVWGIGYRLK